MSRRLSLSDYLASEESNRPRELAFGVVREPPLPTFGHQVIVGRLHSRLDTHVSGHRLGQVVMAPIDVVLDRRRALVVQPDVVFVSAERLALCRERIWGAPDLVVEVLSTATQRHDRTQKFQWYQHYGVRECWFVDPIACDIEVRHLTGPGDAVAVFERGRIARSHVLPRLRLRVDDVFERDASR